MASSGPPSDSWVDVLKTPDGSTELNFLPGHESGHSGGCDRVLGWLGRHSYGNKWWGPTDFLSSLAVFNFVMLHGVLHHWFTRLRVVVNPGRHDKGRFVL